MKSPALFAVASLFAIAGCGSTPANDDVDAATDAASRPDTNGVDVGQDCDATCVRATSGCTCMMQCHGHAVVGTCVSGTCMCTSDGASTFSYTSSACDPSEFIVGCQGMLPDAGSDGGAAPVDGGTDAYTALGAPTYTTETRMITSSGIDRSYVLSTPSDLATRGSLPLVFSLHGDGGDGASMRTALPLEAHFATDTGAVFVYPNAPGGSFEYWTDDGRTKEAQFVRDVIAALHTELNIDTAHVFVAGFSGGATMTNALACLLGPSVLRGVGIHSGTLYSIDGPSGPEFTYTSDGGVSCALPDALFVWGQDDMTDVSFADGESTRDNYVATGGCASSTTNGPISPCVTYDSCTHGVAWCPIPGMAHAIWPSAAEAIGDFFTALP